VSASLPLSPAQSAPARTPRAVRASGTKRSRGLSAFDLVIIASVGLWSWIAFVGGGDNFSYDYGNYIAYFERMRDLGADDLWAQLQAFFPYPYVLVPPAGFFEIGFVGVTWSLLIAGLGAETVYALVGTASIVLRLVLLRALGLGWMTVALVTIYSVTLFEANAIRLGCALTATVAALWAWRRGRVLAGILLLVLAALMHLQTLAFTLPFAVAMVCAPLLRRHRAWRLAAVAITMAGALGVILAPSLSDFGKLGEYADIAAGSVGLNLASVSGALALALGSWVFVQRFGARGPLSGAAGHDADLWSAVHIAALPAVVLVLLAVSLGALGDRVWQFAFMAAIAALPLGRACARTAGRRLPVMAYDLTLHMGLAIAVVNVTLRYPLSNFFAPLLPFVPISPSTLIVL